LRRISVVADGINHCERPLAIADQHPLVRGLHAHIVGIVTQLESPGRGQILASQHSHRTITGIRHHYAVRKRDIRNALRLAQASDPAQYLARRQINHADTVIAELGNKEPLPLRIDAEMIDAATDLTERDLRLEHQRCGGRLRQQGRGPHQACRDQYRRDKHAQLFTILMCASAAFSPSASFLASSLAQKCMK
jgi:hypothetical protein